MNSSMLLPMPADVCSSARCEITLETGQIWSAHLPHDTRVRCVRGVLWLTQSDDATDLVLSAGQSFVAHQGSSHVVAQAINGQVAVLEIMENRKPKCLTKKL